MPTANISFIFQIQNIQLRIYQTINKFHSVFVFRTKLTSVCDELFRFHKYLSRIYKKDIDNRIVSPSECRTIAVLIHELNELTELFKSLDADNYIETIKNCDPSFVNNYIVNLKKSIYGFCSAVNAEDLSYLEFFKSNLELDFIDWNDLLQKLNDLPKISLEITKKVEQIIKQMKSKAIAENTNFETCYITDDEFNQLMNKFDIWNVDEKDLIIQKRLGYDGSYLVFDGYQKSTKRTIICKKITSKKIPRYLFTKFRLESELLSKLDHFSVVSFVGVSWQSSKYIVTEESNNGSLFNFLHSKNNICDPTKLTIIALGVAYGMEYIHKQGFMHGNLNSKNVLLDQDFYPKITNFSLISDNNKITFINQTSEIQNTAPEALTLQQYSDKTDVYNYGILLWEMLTKEIPNSGTNPIDSALRVINHEYKLLIPKNCPMKLATLINLCWERSPEVRPDFGSIVKFLETGVSFPGTSNETIKAYIEYVKNFASTNKKVVGNFTIDDIIQKIDDDISNIVLVDPLLKKESTKNYIYNSHLISVILGSFRKCNSSTYASLLFDISLLIIKDPKYKSIFIKNKFTTLLIELFTKYGATSMESFLPCLKMVIQEDPIKITIEQYYKLSTFLLSNDLSQRMAITEIFEICIDNKLYSNDFALSSIILNLVKNIKNDVIPEFLYRLLSLLYKIISLPKSFTYLGKINVSKALIPILQHNDEKIVLLAFKIIKKIILTSSSAHFANQFIMQTPSLIDKYPPRLQFEVFIVLSMLHQNSNSIRDFICNQNTLYEPFVKAFNSEEYVTVFVLQFCYSFLGDKTTFPFAKQFFPNYIQMMYSNKESISLTSTACVTRAIDCNEEIPNDVIAAISTFLSSDNDKFVIAGLQIVGVLSTNKKSAKFLHEKNIYDKLVKILQSSNQEIITLILMVLSSQTCYYINPDILIKAIPFVMEYYKNKYATLFISNISFNTRAAFALIPYLETIIDSLDVNNPNISFILTTLNQIFRHQESFDYIGEPSLFIKIFKKLESLIDTPFEEYSFELMNEISVLERGKEMLLNYGILNLFNEQQDKLPKESPIQAIIDEIISRIISN